GISVNARADASPPDVRDEWEWAVRLISAAIGVVHEDRASADVLAGHGAPVAAVLRFVAVVAHHEVVAGGDDEGAPVIEHGLRWRGPEARLLELHLVLPVEQRINVVGLSALGCGLAHDSVALALGHTVHVEQAGEHVERVAGPAHQ